MGSNVAGSANFIGMGRRRIAKSLKMGGVLLLSTSLLAGCEPGTQFNLRDMLAGNQTKGGNSQRAGATTKTTERDIEAPEVFSATEAGLWDGRPSLGGVWVAHPDVTDPERVIIRNTENGRFVVGALFRRERDIPGPRLQISSDAAEALGMLAGAPAQLNVTALRKEQVAVEAQVDEATQAGLQEAAEISETPLDPIAAAEAALNEPPQPPQVQAKPRAASGLSKPFLQIGIFSVEANAKRTAQQMRNAGLVPAVKRGESAGKPFWRVVVGPASNASERKTLLAKIKDVGFSDAYAVTN